MIDEELYQYATDELNSERRDSELWNRACALSRDDHDEARFLYTNLRVEELLEQKANGEPLPEMPESVKGAASVAFDLDAAPNAIDSAPLGLGSALGTSKADSGVESEEIISSSNRAFSDESSADLSEELVLDLQSANQANAADDDSIIPDAPISFSGTESKLDLADGSPEFDLDAVSALNNEPSSVGSDVDMDIASLAAQASEQLQGNVDTSDVNALNTGSLNTESMEDALDSAGSMDSTAFNTDKLDSLAAETGAFEPLDDSSIGRTATPLPDAADVVPESTSLNENELAFLDASIDKGRDDIIDQQREVIHQKDALTEELERQADSFMPDDRTSSLTEFDESDLASSASDIDSINTRSANIDAVAETMESPIAGVTADANAASDLDEVFSDSNLEQIRAQNNAAVSDFDDADIDALTQDNVVSDYAGQAVDSVGDMAGSQADGMAGGVTGAVAAGGAALATSAAFAKEPNSPVSDQALHAQGSGSQISQDFSQPGNLSYDDNSPSLDQAELLSGKGQTYRVFSKGPDNNRAVRTGVSWVALFFTLPWLLVKRMPLMAIVYALLWVTLIAGLLITGMQWLDAPQNAQNTLAIWPLAFAALAVVGLIILPFFMGNRWHARSLVNRGYEEIALVRAKGPRRAIDRIMRMAS